MSDVEEQDVDVADESGVDEDYEFVEDEFLPEEEEAPGEEEAKPQDTEREERIEQLKSRLEGDGAETRTAMQEIARTMQELRKEPDSKETEQELEDLETLEKRIANGFYDDPVAAMKQYYDARTKKYEQETLRPAFQQMGQVLRETAKATSKSAATSDTDQFVMDKYADEVDQLVDSGQIQLGPNAYKEAIGRVAANHMDELLDWKLEQREKQQAATAAPSGPGRNASPSGTTAAPTPSSKVKVSQHARDVLARRAKNKGINERQYIDWFVANKKDELRKLNRGA